MVNGWAAGTGCHGRIRLSVAPGPFGVLQYAAMGIPIGRGGALLSFPPHWRRASAVSHTGGKGINRSLGETSGTLAGVTTDDIRK